ncbi:MAG: sigma-54 dependent transcriptional regulator [Candidatus Aminicenantaceae bacterium]
MRAFREKPIFGTTKGTELTWKGKLSVIMESVEKTLGEQILVVDDEQSMLEFLEYVLKKEGYRVSSVQESQKALELLSEKPGFDLVISDLRMPELDGLGLLKASREIDPEVPFIFMTAYASSDTAIEALKLGAFDYITKPFQVEELTNLIRNALLAQNLKHRVRVLEKRIEEDDLIGTSPAMLEIYKLIGTIAPTDTTILITGESGTGKELVARAIHQASLGPENPFVSINCGAFPETLLESELFGYMKGAFTGAVSEKKGLLEVAVGGTLFLDEVGEMPPSMQVKVLRALQEKKIRRIGGTKEIDIDARLIAATNQILESLVEEGKFREDLYYRLAVIPIHIPPLRDRKPDIVPLVRHFIQKYNERLKREVKGVTEEGLSCLEEYSWPGNVRELENVIERAITLESGEFIQKAGLPERVRGQAEAHETDLPRFSADEGLDLEEYLKTVERQIIEQALELAEGNQTRTSEILQVSYRSLRHRLDTLGLRKKQKERSGERREGERRRKAAERRQTEAEERSQKTGDSG